jgi:hypothetical protein
MSNLTADRFKALSVCALLTLAVITFGCAGGPLPSDTGVAEAPQALTAEITENLASSLHATAGGMKWWYEQPNGLGALINVPFASTTCGDCHTTGCSDCHGDLAGTGPVDQPAVCLNCHGRQQAEGDLGVSDVHLEKGMTCSDCHTTGDIHGDGTAYNSMLQDGAIDADCANCHTTVPQIQDHSVHGDKLHCDACHVSTVTTCYNCHFNTLLEDHKKKAYKKFTGFVLLLNDANGKVRAGSYQSVIKDRQTFVAFGPFHGHSVMAKGRTCGDCHNNERVRELNETGKIIMTRWDDTLETPAIVHTTGILPFVPDALQLQFVDYDKAKGTWSPVTTQTDQTQWEFCSPLTGEQIKALSAARGG